MSTPSRLDDPESMVDRHAHDAPLLTVALSRPLASHLRTLARELTGGDFEALVVWAEVAHRNISAGAPDGADPGNVMQQLDRLAMHPDLARPALLHELTSATGIPRETVRRKLARLASQGFLRRHGAGWVIQPEQFPRENGPG